MKTITIDLPDSIELDEQEAKIYLVSRLFEVGILSLAQAAEMVKMNKKEFMEVVGNYGVSLFNYSPEELIKDVENVRSRNR
ncbi:MAG: UPF0175 family protein [Lewinellaceae bacterium]|nr:UPF0175 family protein [Phaeodactylibacter sp.]MCB0615088.1 UPF0175 family protein [Phaeodactylibacter sp.]MCB9348588.1 UPF0175 family protein [Lewinellaceae bacterium]